MNVRIEERESAAGKDWEEKLRPEHILGRGRVPVTASKEAMGLIQRLISSGNAPEGSTTADKKSP